MIYGRYSFGQLPYFLLGKILKVTGIEVVKVMYLALKFGGFPIIALLYGYNFKQYEYFFDRHIDDVLKLSIGSGVGIVEAINQFSQSVSMESSIKTILFGIFLVAVKSVIGVIVTAIATWLLKIVSPFFVKRSEPLKMWLKKTFK